MTTAPTPKPAKPQPKAPVAEDIVECRVTKFGDGRISTGKRAEPGTVDDDGAPVGDLTYAKGETIVLPRSNAEALEARHYVEIAE